MMNIMNKTGGIMMAINTHVTNVLNGTISAIKSVLPLTIEINKPDVISQPFEQEAISVLIGMTGDVPGRLMIEGTETCMSKIGESMFGMPLEGEMLESFAAELGNMIAGNLATTLSQNDITMDITPPTVLVGKTRLYGFKKAISLPIQIENVGTLHAILMVEI
jgi:chemotaxis protein CheX